ncbi:uncharacterized protein LOC119372443 isoform X2 [Rhipicephalus sanguineus]|uniref:uncharacterized protein LOC119372443 isoform X2 n=1 Tax=Rhipicephalus sanguineus TaxID=34632 RepID=UPI0018951986|nr:uncharacterized protein LOC119372443 isoform X2 [Rhipicephalus sanguineus]
MAARPFMPSTLSSSSSSSVQKSRSGKDAWQTLAKWAMSRSSSSSDSSLSSTILKGSNEEDDSRNESQMHRPHSLTRSPQRSLRGDTTSRLQNENVKRKRTLREAGSPPEMSPRKMSRPESEKVASSMTPRKSASLAGPAVAAPRRSFWGSPRRKEAASDSLAQSAVQSGRKSAPEQKSADGFTRAEQRLSDIHLQLSASSQRKSKKRKKSVKRPAGYKALRDITRYQSSVETLIPRLPFARFVREVLFRLAGTDFKMQKLALSALHEASEAVIVAILEGTNVVAHNSRRVTIMNRDLDVFLTLLRNYGTMSGCIS